ncbi:MAG: chromosomal replication initiator protein DnaA [Proteobacteria bacterium]|nr:chromosomal replication initiator protein DnaA [Pseudomonadota bacterium]MBU1639136.1 chromosomal replication initiator protein DnaA [Pseudomonadota bacterium]
MLWQSVKKQLSQKIPENAYSLWISPLKGQEVEDGTLVLTGPDSFFCKWVSDKYLADIQGCMAAMGRENVNVTFAQSAPLLPTETVSEPRQMRLPTMPVVRQFTKALNPRYTFDEFMVGNCNMLAHSACDAIAHDRNDVGKTIYINGGTGLGKSHLTHAVAHHIVNHSPSTRLHYLTAQQLTAEMVKGIKTNTMINFKDKYQKECDVLLIEDVHTLSGRTKTQTELAETLDVLMECGKRVIFTSSKAPREIDNLDEGLRSRLAYGLITTINPPGFNTRLKIIQRKAANYELALNENLVGYLAENVKGDIRQLESIIVGIKAQAALLGIQPDFDMVKATLCNFIGQHGQISVEMIRDFIAGQYKLSINDLQSKSRKRLIAFPRQVCMYLARKHTELPLADIGRALNRDHSTVVHAVRTITTKIARDASTRGQIELLSDKLEKKFL